MVEQAAPGRDKATYSLRLFKKGDPLHPLHPLRRERPHHHPGDLVRIVRLVRTFLQDQWPKITGQRERSPASEVNPVTAYRLQQIQRIAFSLARASVRSGFRVRRANLFPPWGRNHWDRLFQTVAARKILPHRLDCFLVCLFQFLHSRM
jgi:hypothetical protein